MQVDRDAARAPGLGVGGEQGRAARGLAGHVLVRRLWLGRIALVITTVTCAGLVTWLAPSVGRAFGRGARSGTEAIAFSLVFGFLTYGNLVYQLTRLASIRRALAHAPVQEADLDRLYVPGGAPTVTSLIPSYKEEARVITQAILSAALQEYPSCRIVLLIDDPPAPDSPADATALDLARDLPGRVGRMLEEPQRAASKALAGFLERSAEPVDPRDETLALAEACEDASHWFLNQAASWACHDHTDRFFAQEILRKPGEAYLARARELRDAARLETPLSRRSLELSFRRLAARFSATITSFERKAYVNLPHEANKAMNLNAYIGLMGRAFREQQRGTRVHLEPCDPTAADLLVPGAEFIAPLDADSLLLPGYLATLVHLAQQPENTRIGVLQTPYSAVPGATSELERVAGATTDIQYIIHQGFAHYGATFWVGANALLRRQALVDIAITDTERGFTVRKYLRDRTVIEDTESSIDLVERGWHLHSYPERLSYSATPPDFGSLIIQRRRWANGGLIILPTLLRSLGAPFRFRRLLREGLMRGHYLTSLAGANLGLLLMLTYPFDGRLMSPWLPLTAAPYFLLYGHDLSMSGYRFTDMVRVYALGLLLVPANLAGVFGSIRQAVTGRKSPFGRTPKILGRTTTPPRYVVAVYGAIAFLSSRVLVDAFAGRHVHAVLVGANVLLLGYAVTAFVGWRTSLADLRGAPDVARVPAVRSDAMARSEPLIAGGLLLVVLGGFLAAAMLLGIMASLTGDQARTSVIAVLFMLIGGTQIVAGISSIRRKPAGRVVGILCAAIGAAISLIYVLAFFAAGGHMVNAAGATLALVGFLAYAAAQALLTLGLPDPPRLAPS